VSSDDSGGCRQLEVTSEEGDTAGEEGEEGEGGGMETGERGSSTVS